MLTNAVRALLCSVVIMTCVPAVASASSSAVATTPTQDNVLLAPSASNSPNKSPKSTPKESDDDFGNYLLLMMGAIALLIGLGGIAIAFVPGGNH